MFHIHSEFLYLTFSNITLFPSVVNFARSSLFLIVHIALFFLPGTDLPNAFRVPGSGESALIFSSHLLVGQFFSLEFLFPLIQFQLQKDCLSLLRHFFYLCGVRPFFYCDLDFSLPAFTDKAHSVSLLSFTFTRKMCSFTWRSHSKSSFMR